MSKANADAAVERMGRDHDYADAVADQGAVALESFDLTEDERTAILDAVERAKQESADEVEGYGVPTGVEMLSSPLGAPSHHNWIEIMSFSWGASQTSSPPGTGGREVGKVNVSEIKP
jgi:hypothetical protein